MLFALVTLIVILLKVDHKFGDLCSFGHSECVNFCELNLAMDRVLCRALIKRDQMFVGQNKDSVLQKAIAVKLFNVCRVVKSFVFANCLTNVQRFLNNPKCVLLR